MHVPFWVAKLQGNKWPVEVYGVGFPCMYNGWQNHTCMDRKPKMNLINLDFRVTLTDQDTSLIRTPHWSGHLTDQDTPLIRTSHWSGHLTDQDTSPIRTPHWSGHFTDQDTSLIRTSHWSRYLTYHDTVLINTPHRSGHLSLPKQYTITYVTITHVYTTTQSALELQCGGKEVQ